MAVLKRRRSRTYRDFMMTNPQDGLEVNLLNEARFIGRRSGSFSMFDADNVCIELGTTINGHSYHKVSIMGEVKRVNKYKTRKMNGYKDRIQGR